MTAIRQLPSIRTQRQPKLTFAPLAWLKLQFFCHVGTSEIGGFGISAKNDLLYVENFVTVRQRTSPVSVVMEDDAVADFSDRCVDAGIQPQRFLRVWCHTHPGSSAQPSGPDEDTFARVFGACDWAVMFIMARHVNTYARLSYHAGPGISAELPVTVDWSAWPDAVTDPDFSMARLLGEWQHEFATNILSNPSLLLPPAASAKRDDRDWDQFMTDWDWQEFDLQPLEDYVPHERHFDSDLRT